jgi:hypothetical protein
MDLRNTMMRSTFQLGKEGLIERPEKVVIMRGSLIYILHQIILGRERGGI